MKASEAIRNAVEAERAAARFYSFLATEVSGADARKFLEDMAGAELEHARAIQEAGERLLNGPMAERANMDVSMIETLPEWRFVENLSLADAINVALAAEQMASLYYDALSDLFENGEREFFLGLARTEDHHAELLQAKRSLLEATT